MESNYNQSGIYIDKKMRRPSFGMDYDHTHSYCEIYYLKSGACTYTVNRRSFHLRKGDLFIVKAGDAHRSYYEGTVNSERIVISCELNALPETFMEAHEDICNMLSSTMKVVLSEGLRQKIENIFEQMLSETQTPDDFTSDFMRLLMMSFLLTLQRGGVFVHEHPEGSMDISSDIEQAINYIALKYAYPVTLDELAEEFSLCPSYFSKKFKAQTGSTFKEYLNYIRMKQAAQMLITTDDSITKIALSCGFNSSNYFKDCFRKKHDMSPRAFREIYKQ